MVENMEKKLLLSLVILIVFVMLTGCLQSNQENGIKIDYQIFNSNNVVLPDYLVENLSYEDFYDITEMGKALAFQVEYPSNWKAEFNIESLGIFSVIFYPKDSNKDNLKSITLELMDSQPNITISKLKPNYLISFTDYTESEFNISDEIEVWKIIGTPQDYSQEYQNFKQGIAYMIYDNIEIYFIKTFFNDSDSKNMKIFNHMINSFKK